LQKQLNELENKALRSQMNPHFIFNSLNSINSYIIKNKPDEASAYVSKFARLIRLILDNSRETHIALESELMALNLYIEIENKRFANKFSWNIQIHSNIDLHSTLIPPMIIQPFVENAIWHGLLHQEKQGILTISIQEQNGYLEISIDDNGVGRDAAKLLKSKTLLKDKSHGMEVTINRIENFNAGFSLGKAVEIIDKKDEFGNPTGTTMLLKIALIKNEQEIP
jgi:sensor histidine kinase YesM